jgi:hypothetical protein
MRLFSTSSYLILLCALSTQALAATKSSFEAKSACAIVAATFANANVTTVDIWLDRYHSTFTKCFANNVSKSATATSATIELVEKKSARALIRKSRPKTIKSQKPKEKLSKVVAKVGIKRTVVIPAKISIKENGKNSFQLPKKTPQTATNANESWKANCSPMFGTEESSFYLSSTGKRTSCITLLPK